MGPLVRYYGDFGALIPVSLGPKALAAFAHFCDLLGIYLQVERSQVGARVTYLGLEGPPPPLALKRNGAIGLSYCGESFLMAQYDQSISGKGPYRQQSS